MSKWIYKSVPARVLDARARQQWINLNWIRSWHQPEPAWARGTFAELESSASMMAASRVGPVAVLESEVWKGICLS
jgi:hypothetical protein